MAETLQSMFHFQQERVYHRDFTCDRQARKDAYGIISTATLIFVETGCIDSVDKLFVYILSQMFSRSQASEIYEGTQKSCLNREMQTFNETLKGQVDTSWMVALASSDLIPDRRVAFVIFDQPLTLGTGFQCIKMFSLVLCSSSVTVSKGAGETALTVATFLSDAQFRRQLCLTKSSLSIGFFLDDHINRSQEQHSFSSNKKKRVRILNIWTGLAENFTRRLSYYWSDFVDGVKGERTICKVISSSLFLFFLCVLPTVAFGVLNAKNTENKLDADRALVGQAIGGLLFALISGQPFVIIATTAPLALCTSITYRLSQEMGCEFYDMYAAVGLFNCLFLACYGLLGIGSIIDYSRRCVEEIFLMFSFVCFMNDAFAEALELFLSDNDFGDSDGKQSIASNKSFSLTPSIESQKFLFILLLLGTTLMACVLFSVKFCRLATRVIRDTISDYALPAAVVIFSIIGYFIKDEKLGDLQYYPVKGSEAIQWRIADVTSLNTSQVAIAAILGFAVSILFFMDQGISAQLVNTPTNGLKKGNANDLDFVIVALVNVFTSLFGLPLMHGLLPHSPLHVQSLADFEERVGSDGQVRTVVTYVRETRLAALFCHILITISVLYLPFVFELIPVPVLNGLFFYCAIACLRDNSFFDRLLFLITQPSQLPPAHCLRVCSRKSVNGFTVVELVLTLILTFIGFSQWPFLRICFPLFIAILIPIRHVILTRVFNGDVVRAVDSYE